MVIASGAAVAATEMLNALLVVWDAASETRTLKLNVPDTLGVPESAPFAASPIPEGSDPEVRLKL